MKHYTIKINKNNNNNGFNFRNNNNASKELDDLILSNMIKLNPYLDFTKKNDSSILKTIFTTTTPKNNDSIIISNRPGDLLKDTLNFEFGEAAKFLANYKPTKSIYTFDNNDITFFEDEIQIGSTLIPLYMLESPMYYSRIPKATKDIIINIYISIKG